MVSASDEGDGDGGTADVGEGAGFRRRYSASRRADVDKSNRPKRCTMRAKTTRCQQVILTEQRRDGRTLSSSRVGMAPCTSSSISRKTGVLGSTGLAMLAAPVTATTAPVSSSGTSTSEARPSTGSTSAGVDTQAAMAVRRQARGGEGRRGRGGNNERGAGEHSSPGGACAGVAGEAVARLVLVRCYAVSLCSEESRTRRGDEFRGSGRRGERAARFWRSRNSAARRRLVQAQPRAGARTQCRQQQERRVLPLSRLRISRVPPLRPPFFTPLSGLLAETGRSDRATSLRLRNETTETLSQFPFPDCSQPLSLHTETRGILLVAKCPWQHTKRVHKKGRA